MLEDNSYEDIVSWGVNGDSFVVKVIKNANRKPSFVYIPQVSDLLKNSSLLIKRKSTPSQKPFFRDTLNIPTLRVSYVN